LRGDDARAGVTEAATLAERVAAAAEELSSTVQEISGSAAQIMAAIGEIDRGVGQQAAATTQSAAAASQIEAGARAALAAAEEALAQTLAMAALVASSRRGIDALIGGSTAAAARTRDTLAALAALGRRARTIERTVGSIETVAVQISMLAVSGAVEAARAGDDGRGFAHVSADIKTLAADAAANTGRIRDTVEEVQDRVAAARQDFDALAAALAVEAQRSRQLPLALARVGEDLDTVRTANEDVRQGADAIFAAISDVSQGAREIGVAAEQASRSASEAAAAARQQARGAEELAAAIEEIASLAESLSEAAF
jgi:methyl-accepting chemotaxis protein